jgi:hypothetical protein
MKFIVAMAIILDEGMLGGLCNIQIEHMVFAFLFVLFNGTIVFYGKCRG